MKTGGLSDTVTGKTDEQGRDKHRNMHEEKHNSMRSLRITQKKTSQAHLKRPIAPTQQTGDATSLATYRSRGRSNH